MSKKSSQSSISKGNERNSENRSQSSGSRHQLDGEKTGSAPERASEHSREIRAEGDSIRKGQSISSKPTVSLDSFLRPSGIGSFVWTQVDKERVSESTRTADHPAGTDLGTEDYSWLEGLEEEVVTYCLEESQETGNVICFPDNIVDPLDKMSEDAPPPPSHRFCGLVLNRVYSYVPLADRRELVVGSDYARTDCRSLASLDLANHCVALVS